jgi:trans-2,3-dihydro-3-hydroxyanthranilate isomerase
MPSLGPSTHRTAEDRQDGDMDLEYDVVDVFAERPFAGNQLAVVHGTDGMDTGQLHTLAIEFGFSETTFPTPVADDRYRVRIFTPGGEIPFAGHPTLGTAWVLRERGAIGDDATQVCGAGEIGVRFLTDDRGELVELSAVRRDLGPVPEEMVADLLADHGIDASCLAGEARYAGAGLTWIHLPVTDDAIAGARPGRSPVPDLPGAQDPCDGVNVYALTAPDQVHARVFVPGLSVDEDAATGSAAAGLGVALADLGLVPADGRVTISQGAEMGRPSRLHVTVTDEAGEVRVAGAVQPIASGRIARP